MTSPTTVKSIVLTNTGDFDAISQIEVPFPAQGQDEILVKVCRDLVLWAGHNYSGLALKFIMEA